MESIARGIDKLPIWAKLVLLVFTVLGCIYYVARYGSLSYLLRVIFSP